jgi:hypothetical protein
MPLNFTLFLFGGEVNGDGNGNDENRCYENNQPLLPHISPEHRGQDPSARVHRFVELRSLKNDQ